MANQRVLDALMERVSTGEISPEMALGDAIDSLTFIDLFLDIERDYASAIALDDVVACKTMGDLCGLIDKARAGVNASREPKR